MPASCWVNTCTSTTLLTFILTLAHVRPFIPLPKTNIVISHLVTHNTNLAYDLTTKAWSTYHTNYYEERKARNHEATTEKHRDYSLFPDGSASRAADQSGHQRTCETCWLLTIRRTWSPFTRPPPITNNSTKMVPEPCSQKHPVLATQKRL